MIQSQAGKEINSMALNISAAASVSLHPKPSPFLTPRHAQPFFKLHSSSYCFIRTSAQSDQGAEAGVSEEDPSPAFSGSSSSLRTQLDLLEQLTSTSSSAEGYESDGGSRNKLTIRERLAQFVGDRDDNFSLPLGKNLKKVSPKLTISQKRNIKRQTYLNEVSRRNDSKFFATIGAFVLVPPILILGIAIATGYVQLLP